MSRAGFDYLHVWSPTLQTATPIVHDPAGRDHYLDDRWERRTKCGVQVMMRGRYDPNSDKPPARRLLLSLDDYGVHLYAGHAKAIGARWCKLCWPIYPRGPAENVR